MEIITKDNKDYLKTVILKVDSQIIECSKFFEDLENALETCRKNQGKEVLSYEDYGSNIQAICNRFSGTYFSPSFMTSYTTNPANAIFSMVAKEELTDATSIGSHVHKILELYYSQAKDERVRSDLLDYVSTVPEEIRPQVEKYIQGYIPSKDYLDETKELNDADLDCFCEYRGKTNVYIPKFDLNLPMKLSYVVDRIDIRGDKAYIIDYKTGYQPSKSATFDGYLGSMLLYKWVIEQDFSMPVAGGYLSVPGNADKYYELDFSLVNESKMVEKVFNFYEQFKADNKNRIYRFTNKGYFSNRDMKYFQTIMNQDNEPQEIEVEVYLGEHQE